jgi:hypothetical protein
MIVLVQGKDVKVRLWQRNAEDNISIVGFSGSPILVPIKMLYFIARKGIPDAYVFRYLNDYPSLVQTLLRVLSELLVIAICKLLGVKVAWLCHNVDKETNRFFPALTAFRRKAILWASKGVFVTSEFLLPFALKELGCKGSELGVITFGRIEEETIKSVGVDESFIYRFIDDWKSRHSNVKVLFCASTPGLDKCKHFEFLESLIAEARESGVCVLALVAGDFEYNDFSKTQKSAFEKNDQIFLVGNYATFSSSLIVSKVDFYWRVYDDLSVPYTIYEAVSYSKPTLTMKYGILPEIVSGYNVGDVIADDFSNIKDVIDGLKDLDQDVSNHFFAEHTWASMSRQISRMISR